MIPEPPLLERFAADLNALIAPGARIGIAVSGGPDSLALLLLAAGRGHGNIEAATLDHALREGSRAEAEVVASVCARIGVHHAILTAEWDEKPVTAVQERARDERYRLLAKWAKDRQLDAIVTAHHADDQAETLLMRLARGAGVRGLAGMRAVATVPGSEIPLLRPLLGWRRAELERIVAAAGLQSARDPSNEDEHYERVRVRRVLTEARWLQAQALAASAAHLGQAETALEWSVEQEWARTVTQGAVEILYRPGASPAEIRRRIVARAIARLATEGEGTVLRGQELDRLLNELRAERTTTLRGVRCTGGETWRFVPAPNRTRPVDKLR